MGKRQSSHLPIWFVIPNAPKLHVRSIDRSRLRVVEGQYWLPNLAYKISRTHASRNGAAKTEPRCWANAEKISNGCQAEPAKDAVRLWFESHVRCRLTSSVTVAGHALLRQPSQPNSVEPPHCPGKRRFAAARSDAVLISCFYPECSLLQTFRVRPWPYLVPTPVPPQHSCRRSK